MRTRKKIGLAAVLLGLAGVVAMAAGFSVRYQLAPDGTVEIVNQQSHAVWRPTVVALQFGASADRTIEISRVAGSITYPIASFEAEGSTYVYEFEANYWFSRTQAMRVAVTPASTGIVEVIYE